jgi:hypothetical protein
LPVWLQRYLDIPPSDGGEGTAWRILWESPWPVWMPDWFGWLSCVSVVGLILFVISRDAGKLARFSRITLMTLRVAVLILLLVLICRPVLSVNRTIDPLIVILVDTSESMSLKDEYKQRNLQAAAKQSLDAINSELPTRLNISRGLLLADDAKFLKTLLKSHKIRVYRFAETAISLHAGELTTEQELPELLETLRTLESSGQETKPGDAVKQILSELKATPPSSIIVVSDGIATGHTSSGVGRLSDAIEDLKKDRVSAWTIGIGSQTAARDIRLVEVRVPEIAFLDDLITFECLLDHVGFKGETTELMVEIRENQEIVISDSVTFSDSKEPQTITLEWQPDLTGEIEFAIRATPLTEETDRDNNQLIRKILIRDQPLKVLLAEDRPRYEYRYLKHFLEREPSVDLDSVLLGGDLQQSLQDPSGQKLAGRFPVRKDQIDNYDVIILGDLGPQDVGPGVVNLLREAVESEGLSIILIGGPQKNPQAWKGSAFEAMFPIAIERASFAPPLRWQERGFQPRPTIAGLQTTPAFRWGDDQPGSSSYWDELSPWYRFQAYPHLKPGAVTWLTTEPLGEDRPGLPLLVEQRFGTGKVLFHATDEMWRLRFLTQDKFYGRFWLQTLRYLTRSSASDQLGEITTDRRIYERGEAVQVRLKSSLVKAADSPQITLTGPESFRKPLSASELHPELFTTELTGLPEGTYQVGWTSAETNQSLTTDFRIELAQQELKNRNLNQTELQKVAEKTGGRYATIETAKRIPELIPPGQKILLEALAPRPLWNRWELLVLLFGLLTAEWVLRKRHQLI